MQENDSKLELQAGKVVWLSREIVGWPTGHVSRAPGDPQWERHYESWNHANDSLVGTASEQDRASAIFQLKRSLEFRENALNSVYEFNKMTGIVKKGIPAALEMFNIVLPIMRKTLTDVRNDVTHDFSKPPPDIHRCRELAEFTWYFLKSTDHLLSSTIRGLEFEDYAKSLWGVEFDVQPVTWKMQLTGRVNRDLFSVVETEDAFRVVFGRDVSIEKSDVHFKDAAVTASCNLMRDFLKVYFSYTKVWS
jgi:hypothetical protein